ncbi:hypothetical protein D3C75_135980 [compost metagenome]
MAKSGVPIGLNNLVYAIMLNDPEPGAGLATYSAPVRIPGAITASINPNASNETLFADDGPYDAASTIGNITLELNVADLSLETQAELLGHTIVGGVLIRKAADIPPYVAIGFKSLKSDGKYRYTWLAKGKFAASEQANQTKQDSINWNTPTISGSFLKRDCDDEWERHIDEGSIDYIPSLGANWFNNPYGTPSGSIPALTASAAPANNATAVPVNASVVWTFNNALALSTVTKGNFLLMVDASGSVVAGDLTINAARTIVTFKPTANLTASTKYRAVVSPGVTDLNGGSLATGASVSFTTA